MSFPSTRTSAVFSAFLMALSLIGCTKDFEQINQNPNYPEQAASELLLPGVMGQMAYNWGNQGWEEGFTVVQYASRLQFTSGDRYNWPPTDNPYYDAYDSMRDIENVIRDNKDNLDGQNYYGVALVIKSWIYSYLTDAYGDIPYTDATKGITEGKITPDLRRNNKYIKACWRT